MDRIRKLARAGSALVALTLLVAGSPAIAQPEKLDKYSLEAWGGTWMVDCASGKGAKVIIAETSLTFENGKNRVVGTNFRAAASWFGNSPPENYVTAMLADQPEDLQFLAVVYKDAKGEYLKLDGDPKLMAAVGKAHGDAKYRRCVAPADAKAGSKPATGGGGGDAKASAPAPAPAADAAAAGAATAGAASAGAAAAGDALPPAYGMLEDPGFKKAYTKALGKLGKETWLATLDGPSSESRKVTVAGEEYVLSSSCKAHDCYENNMVVLYSSAKKVAYGKVYMAGKSSMFGNPPAPVAKEIGEFWRQTYRSNP